MSPKVRRGYDAAGVRAVLLAGTAVFVTIVAPRPAVAADLDNTTPYENSTSFAGNVTGNSSTIDNDAPGYWTGNILGNGPADNGSGTINNNDGATWSGAVEGNDGNINNLGTWLNGDVTNSGTSGFIGSNGADASWSGAVEDNYGTIQNTAGTWTGNVVANESGAIIINDNTFDDDSNPVGTGYWYGDVVSNGGTIFNAGGGIWTGKVDDNDSLISNDRDIGAADVAGPAVGVWNGDVTFNESGGDIESRGIWNGNLLKNAGSVYNTGVWNGTASNTDEGVIFNVSDRNNPDDIVVIPVWTGDVVSNSATDGVIYNQGGIWDGDVESNGGLIENAGAVFIDAWTGNSTWSGKVLGNSGTIDNGDGSQWTGDVVANTATIDNEGDWNGDIEAGNTGTVTNTATYSDHTDQAVWTGDVLGNGGTITNSGGAWNGDVKANKGTITNESITLTPGGTVDGVWTGDIAGNDGTIDNAAGGQWKGKVSGNAADGTITNEGTWTGDVTGNLGTITTTGIWDGDFTSDGIVNAKGQINGAFTNDGTLNLTGGLSGITTLTNNGIFDMRPAGVDQSMTVGNVSFDNGSTWDIALNASPTNDRLNVTGSASLGGTLDVTAGTGFTYDRATTYTILTAGSISGTFSNVTTDLAFLTPRLSMDGDSVELSMLRNDVGYADVGVTPNQQATAAALEALGSQSPLFQAILGFTASQAQAAFDALSGEGLGAAQAASIQNAGVIENLVTSHIDQEFDAIGDGSAAVSNYAAAPALQAPPASAKTGVWGQAYGVRGIVDADGIGAWTGGFAGGIDTGDGDWRLGLMLNRGETATTTGTLDASSDSRDYGVGLYGGKELGDTRFSAGIAYTLHQVQTSRTIDVPGLGETLSADYNAGTAQAFARVSQAFDLGPVTLTPFGSVDAVRYAADGFSESGGPAALTVDAAVVNAMFTTLGLAADEKFAVGDGKLLTARGTLGWRHTVADTPDTTENFAGGGDFTIIDTPIAGDSVVVGAGLDLDLTAMTTVHLGYDGQIGQGSQVHAIKGSWDAQF